jgi:hypothetical protein
MTINFQNPNNHPYDLYGPYQDDYTAWYDGLSDEDRATYNDELSAELAEALAVASAPPLSEEDGIINDAISTDPRAAKPLTSDDEVELPVGGTATFNMDPESDAPPIVSAADAAATEGDTADLDQGRENIDVNAEPATEAPTTNLNADPAPELKKPKPKPMTEAQRRFQWFMDRDQVPERMSRLASLTKEQREWYAKKVAEAREDMGEVYKRGSPRNVPRRDLSPEQRAANAAANAAAQVEQNKAMAAALKEAGMAPDTLLRDKSPEEIAEIQGRELAVRASANTLNRRYEAWLEAGATEEDAVKHAKAGEDPPDPEPYIPDGAGGERPKGAGAFQRSILPTILRGASGLGGALGALTKIGGIGNQGKIPDLGDELLARSQDGQGFLNTVADDVEQSAIARDYAALTGTTIEEAMDMLNRMGADRVNNHAKVQLVIAIMRAHEEALRARYRGEALRARYRR